MNLKSRKALSWSLSFLVHAVLFFFIIRAGIHYALPEGEVLTGQAIDIVEATKGMPATGRDTTTHDKVAPALPKEKAPAQKDDSVVENEPPPKFIPDKEAQDVVPADKEKEETTDDKEAPPAPPKKVVAKKLPQKSTKEEETENPPPENMQAVQETPQQEEAKPQESPAPTVAAATVTTAPETPPVNTPPQQPEPQKNAEGGKDQAGQGTGEGAHNNAPMIDETKLVEMPGNEKPIYPYLARLRRQEGLVVLKAYVGADGRVTDPVVFKSSGSTSLDKECVQAYSQWKYKPGLAGQVLKPFRFNLKEK